MSALTAALVLAMASQPACGAGSGVPPERLLAVAQVEADLDPLTIGINGPGGGDVHPATVADAVETATRLIAAGRSIDLGLMQINNSNLASHGLTVETAFDACANLRAGAEHLAADFAAAWRAAHSRYNTGDLQRGIANGYVARIERVLAATAPPAPAPAAVLRQDDTTQATTGDVSLLAEARSRTTALSLLHTDN